MRARARRSLPLNPLLRRTGAGGDLRKNQLRQHSGAGPFSFANVHFSGVARSCARMLSFQGVARQVFRFCGRMAGPSAGRFEKVK